MLVHNVTIFYKCLQIGIYIYTDILKSDNTKVIVQLHADSCKRNFLK